MQNSTRVLAASSAVNFARARRALEYCRGCSSDRIYAAVKKSCQRVVVWTIMFCLIFVMILGAVMFHFSRGKNSHVTDNGIAYSCVKTGHVGDGVVWYINNDKYEVDISEFGYDIQNFEHGSDFNVYLDENGDVVDIIPEEETAGSALGAYWIVGLMVGFIVFLCSWAIWMRYSKSRLNPGREYYTFMKWYQNAMPGDWYGGYDRIINAK